ncbi:hypothetical protein VOWphi5012_015 [Vibrio phage phi50-12]|uniref:Uncharacterized protein n=1 Tax=Vibrio phage phi50-12 TaxID=2654972 RepID=A0A5P8PR98_9CAUD|nr:virion structural protein [Vibrio phage phi50-12]QFR59799.1 hypothetical protein VOWphi5012_015 [Vibrio phage phi50-12]
MDISDLTTGTIDGTGVFDVLMKSINAQIDAKVADGIIPRDQASQVYEQLTMQAMSQSVQFLQVQQQAKLSEEQIKLVTQQTITEKAKTQDTVDGEVVAGTTGKQNAVLAAQEKGFQQDSINKATSTMVNTWLAQRSTDDGVKPTPENKLQDTDIGAFVTKMGEVNDVTV